MEIPHIPEQLAPAAKAAAAAGQSLMERLRSVPHVVEWSKQHGEIESSADLEAARTIAEVLRRETPSYGRLFEEEAYRWNEDADRVWVIDSLAGTTNFVRGFPLFAVSIGLVCGGAAQAGIVFGPYTGEWFWGTSAGAFYANAIHGFEFALSPHMHLPLCQSIVSVGSGRSPELRTKTTALLAKLDSQVKTVRRLGTVLELCHVALGGIGAYLNNQMAPWDFAPVMPILRQAGAVVTDFAGRAVNPLAWTSILVAADDALHSELLKFTRTVI